MATSLDKEAIRDAYNQVMGDNNGVEWCVYFFKYFFAHIIAYESYSIIDHLNHIPLLSSVIN